MSRDLISRMERILVLIDGSDVSFKAAAYALTIAKLKNAKVICIHVIGPAPYLTKHGIVIAFRSSYYEGAKSQAKEWLMKIKEIAIEDNVDVELEVLIDVKSISKAILDYAKGRDIDLIVMGSRGRTGFKRLLLGSVASTVVAYASCPVLVMK